MSERPEAAASTRGEARSYWAARRAPVRRLRAVQTRPTILRPHHPRQGMTAGADLSSRVARRRTARVAVLTSEDYRPTCNLCVPGRREARRGGGARRRAARLEVAVRREDTLAPGGAEWKGPCAKRTGTAMLRGQMPEGGDDLLHLMVASRCPMDGFVRATRPLPVEPTYRVAPERAHRVTPHGPRAPPARLPSAAARAAAPRRLRSPPRRRRASAAGRSRRAARRPHGRDHPSARRARVA